MIKYVKGNLLKSDVDVIAHGANCFNTMGGGIALQIARQYPEAQKVDRMTSPGDKGKLGTYTKAKSGGKTIYNLYTQYDFGGPDPNVDYAAVHNALSKMRLDVDRTNPDAKIGLPRIGCGLAGGDWSVVELIIEKVFGDREVFVYDL